MRHVKGLPHLMRYALAAVSLVACGAGPRTRAGGAVSPLAVRPVEWNPTHAALGSVKAVADAGQVVAVFADKGATVLSSGAVVATDTAVTDWVDADTIPGADGSARWIVGVDSKGRLYYLHGLSSFENVSPRYGLEGHPVRGAAVLGPGFVGFLLDAEVAIADGRRVARFGSPALTELVGGGGWGAGVARDELFLFDAAKHTTSTFSLEGVTHAAMGPDGRLYATTRRAVYAGRPGQDLALVYDADGDSIHGLVASGEHVWFADGGELGIVDGERVLETTGARVAADAKLVSSPSGDVWVEAQGALQRFARSDPEQGLAAVWTRTLGPVFARACASCHGPNGVSGVDLSSAEAWHSERAAIRERVVLRRTMPPQGHDISDADRAAIRAWTDGGGE